MLITVHANLAAYLLSPTWMQLFEVGPIVAIFVKGFIAHTDQGACKFSCLFIGLHINQGACGFSSIYIKKLYQSVALDINQS